MDSTKKIESIDDLVLVHLTNYIPKNGIIRTPKSAGVVQIEKYNGIEYQKKRERDTIHFVMNGEFENNTGGSWNKIKDAIIIPLKKMKKEKILGGTTVDLYTNGDVEIPEGSYILCLKDEQEILQQEVGKGIQVKGVDGVIYEDEEGTYPTIKGCTNEFLKQLGYKVQSIGFWSWGNKKDEKIATDILSENGWELGAHSFSEHMRDEKTYEDITRTIEIIKIMKNGAISNSSPAYILNNYQPVVCANTLFDNDRYLDTFCEKMEDIGIPISEDIMKEVKSIREGIISDKAKEEIEINSDEFKGKEGQTDYNDRLAEFILRRRVVGEIRLRQIKDSIKENEEIKFENLLEVFDDTLYEFTTEERRIEFLKLQGIELSDAEIKILGNKELKNRYLEILDIKDIPYGELSVKDRIKFSEFREFYYDSFEEVKISDDLQLDKDGNFICAKGAIRKKEGKFTQEEIEMLIQEGKCINNISNIMLVLNNKIYDKDTTLTQYVENCERMVVETNEILKPKTISTEELGEQTLEEQKDTKGRLSMQEILAQKMKEYTINKEQKEGVIK